MVTTVNDKGQAIPHLVLSPASLDYELLSRQVQSVGDIPGPLTLVQLGKLTFNDLTVLEDGVAQLEVAALNQAESEAQALHLR